MRRRPRTTRSKFHDSQHHSETKSIVRLSPTISRERTSVAIVRTVTSEEGAGLLGKTHTCMRSSFVWLGMSSVLFFSHDNVRCTIHFSCVWVSFLSSRVAGFCPFARTAAAHILSIIWTRTTRQTEASIVPRCHFRLCISSSRFGRHEHSRRQSQLHAGFHRGVYVTCPFGCYDSQPLPPVHLQLPRNVDRRGAPECPIPLHHRTESCTSIDHIHGDIRDFGSGLLAMGDADHR